jgi:hypothetical protein
MTATCLYCRNASWILYRKKVLHMPFIHTKKQFRHLGPPPLKSTCFQNRIFRLPILIRNFSRPFDLRNYVWECVTSFSTSACRCIDE